VQQHHTFQTNGLDLGNVDQALWNTAQGRWLNFTLMTPIQSRLALHVEPILLLFVPLYWLNLGSPEVLLIIQATVVALGAWPLYQLSIGNPKGRLCTGQLLMANSKSNITLHAPRSTLHASRLTPLLLLIFPLAYLLLPTLESAVLFDFHAVTLSTTFLLFAFLALEQKNDLRFIFFALLTMACKEDMSLVVAMLGLYLGLAQRRWRLAGLIIGLSAAWFIAAFFLIQPRFAAGGNIQLDRYAWLGDNPLEMLQTLLTQPALVFNHLWNQADLLGYLVALFFPTAFLALLSPLTLLPMLPTLAVNLLSDNPFTWRLEDFHYGAPLAPFLFISAIYGIRRISELASQRMANERMTKYYSFIRPFAHSAFSSAPLLLCSVLLLAFSTLYHYYRGFTPLARPFGWPEVTAHQQRLTDVIPTIPAAAPLFTQSNLAPHLTHRPTIYTDFAYFTDPDFPAPIKAEEILLDITAFENIGGLHQFLRQTLLESGDYEVVTAQDGILRLRPATSDRRPPISNLQSPTPAPYSLLPTSYFLLPTPFYTFTQPDSPPQYPLSIDFGDVVRLHGYSLHFNRQEEVQVSVDLEPLQSLISTPEVQPVLYLLDAEGQPVGATSDLQPALVWFPPAQWPVGEIVRVRFNTLPWYTRQTKNYRLALGMANGNDVWELSHRYRPSLSQPTDFVVRFPADGTLIELAQIQQVWGIPQGGPHLRQFTLPHPPHALQANFANQIKLLGYSTPKISNTRPPTADEMPLGYHRPPASNAQSPISNLTITLYWQAITTPPTLTRFVQLIGPDGQIYGQNDSAPDRGHYPTHLWQPGEVVVETITLPLQPDHPAGDYTLHIGLYRPNTGARLPLTLGGDHVEISP
jgi:uncharacterized membrane protein